MRHVVVMCFLVVVVVVCGKGGRHWGLGCLQAPASSLPGRPSPPMPKPRPLPASRPWPTHSTPPSPPIHPSPPGRQLRRI